MGILDNYKNMIKIQLSGAGAGTTKYGWVESVAELLQFGILVALCLAHKWYIPAGLLIAILVMMGIIIVKK